MFKYTINEVDDIVDFQDYSTSLSEGSNEGYDDKVVKYNSIEFDKDFLDYYENNKIKCFVVPIDPTNVNKFHDKIGFLVVKKNNDYKKEVKVYQYHSDYLDDNAPEELKYLYNNHQGLISLQEEFGTSASNFQRVISNSKNDESKTVFEKFISSIHPYSIEIEKDEIFLSSDLLLTKEKIKFKVERNQKDIEYYILNACSLEKLNSTTPGSKTKYYSLSIDTKNSAISILDKSTTFIYVYDIVSKKIVFSNFKHKKFLDYYESEWNTNEFSIEDKSTDLKQLLERDSKLNRDPVVRKDFKFFSKETKKSYWFSTSKRIYKRDDKGTPTQIIVYANDITNIVGEKKGFKAAYEYNKALMDAIPELIVVLSKQGYVLNIYEGKTQDDYKPDLNVIGKNINEILPEKQAKRFLKLINKAISTKQNIEFYLDRELNGDIFKLNCSCSPIDDEKVILLVKNETKIFDMQKQLEEKVAEISIKNKELESYIEKNDSLENFSFILSHDLKETLRGISGFSEIIQQKYFTNFDERGAQYFQYIRNGILKMNRQLDGVIEYSKLSEESLKIKEVSLKDILNEVEFRISGKIKEKKIILKIDYLPVLKCDRKLLTNVFVNLILNSVESCPDCSEIVVSTKKVDDNYQITVQDNGKGIDRTKLKEVFKMFKKLNHTDKNGMGLAISKKIIECHGGEIWIESNDGFKGTKVIFTIPA